MDPILLSTVADEYTGGEGLIDGSGGGDGSGSVVLHDPNGVLSHPAEEPALEAGLLSLAATTNGETAEQQAVSPAAEPEGPPQGNKEDGDGLDEEEEAEIGYEMTLHNDYPEPLTEPQRTAFQQHVAQAVRKYGVLCRTGRLIRQGLSSLTRLVDRLRSEKESIQAQLDRIVSGERAGDATPAAKAARTEAPAEAPTPSAPKRPNRFGGLLRSAAFANMQKVLNTVQKEETEKFGQVALNRERIAKETRLKLVSEDLASQEEVLHPLLEKLNKCLAMEQQAESAAADALALMSDMFLQESRYASSFTLKAVDASAGDAQRKSSAAADLPTASSTFEVPFMPAVPTAEMEELLRSQVEEALVEYTAYRERIDPVLAVLEQAEQERKAKRLDDLMNVIGVPSADVGRSARSGDGLLGVAEGDGLHAIGEMKQAAAAKRRQKAIKAGFGVSDSDDEDEDSEDDAASEDSLDGLTRRHAATVGAASGVSAPSDNEALGAKRRREDDDGGEGDIHDKGAAVEDGEDSDQKDRKLIQSALSALDDFDEMF